MQHITQMQHRSTTLDGGAAANLAGIDAQTLSHLDINLLNSLLKIGHPRERICSALDLSYAEYDMIIDSLESTGNARL